jgi:glycosyltransferase involved in cell wall biosynthesis
MGARQISSPEMTAPWVLIAGDFHRRGGMDRANLALAEYLLELKIPTHLVAHQVDANLSKHPLAQIHPVPRPAGSHLLGAFLLSSYGRKIARRVSQQHAQAQVVVNGGNCIWPGVNWAHYVHHAWRPTAEKGAPLMFRVKGALASSRARRTERKAFRRARLVISNSERTSREIVQYFGVDKTRIHTVYLGTDPDWGPVTPVERAAGRQAFQIEETRATAVFVGALGYDQRKGFDVLFGAWRELCAKADWDVDLLVAGGGPALPMWQTSVQQAGLSGRIRLLGHTDQVKKVLAAADVLVSPVRYEAYGLNVQEAICRGIPAMVTGSAGVAERYPLELAQMLIPDPEDPRCLIERLLAWRASKDEWRARFQPLSDRLRSRSWRDTAVDIVAIASRS